MRTSLLGLILLAGACNGNVDVKDPEDVGNPDDSDVMIDDSEPPDDPADPSVVDTSIDDGDTATPNNPGNPPGGDSGIWGDSTDTARFTPPSLPPLPPRDTTDTARGWFMVAPAVPAFGPTPETDDGAPGTVFEFP